jgi:putative ABC transport system substrate-binding protein
MQFGQMRRREFITLLGGAATWPLPARAQQAAKVARIGFKVTGLLDAFRQGLRERG